MRCPICNRAGRFDLEPGEFGTTIGGEWVHVDDGTAQCESREDFLNKMTCPRCKHLSVDHDVDQDGVGYCIDGWLWSTNRSTCECSMRPDQISIEVLFESLVSLRATEISQEVEPT